MRAWLAFLLLLFASGCDEAKLARLKTYLPGPALLRKEAPSAKVEPAGNARANSELLAEIFRVVFGQDPSGSTQRSLFFSLNDVLNQGASLEGVYNGLTHSADYRQLEIEKKGATPEALKRFSLLLAAIQAELPAASRFDASSARPLALPVQPVYRETGGHTEIDPGTQAAKDRRLTAEDYRKIFLGASIFTLKRVLGDESLKMVSSKAAYPEKLALWYSKWAVQMAGEGVDFGLPLRQSTDEHFHYRWALAVPEDRVKWEVLNRMLRLLSAANR